MISFYIVAAFAMLCLAATIIFGFLTWRASSRNASLAMGYYAFMIIALVATAVLLIAAVWIGKMFYPAPSL